MTKPSMIKVTLWLSQKQTKNPELPMFYHQSDTDLGKAGNHKTQKKTALKDNFFPKIHFVDSISFDSLRRLARETCAQLVFIWLPF